MNKTNTKTLYEKFPYMYREHTKKPGTETTFWAFEFDDGWYDLILNLSVELDAALTEEEKEIFKCLQCKEKMAGLRFYWNNYDFKGDRFEHIMSIINKYAAIADKTCELCGESGKIRGTRYYKTLCNKCTRKEHEE